MNVQPFPYASLERLTRAEILAGRDLRRFVRSSVRVDDLAAALASLASAKVSVLERSVRRADPSRSDVSAVGVVLSSADGGTPALVEVEAALASAVVARVLGRPAPRVIDAARPAPSEISGAVAAVILAAVRRAHAGVAPRVLAAGPAAVLARDFCATNAEAVTAFLTVVVDDDAYDARVTVPSAAVPRAEGAGDVLASLGDAPIALPLVVARCLATRAELADLRPGDAFLVPPGAIRCENGAVVGPVVLAAGRAERGLGADLAEGGRLVLRGRVESVPWGAAMNDEAAATTREVLEEAPVVVRVELGAVEMKASEWAALGPGDVIALGRRVGEPAVLRVNGAEVARGELVQVDGEYGVRIVGRGSR